MKRKHFYKHLCSSLIGLSACLSSEAQSIETFSFNSTLTPSVESFSISKFGKLSPSLYTGAMSYNLPLYTYKDGDFSIPISFDYSFSGYKPAQHSGSVGYGWALNCGGIITREVIGLPDDARPGDQDGLGYAIALAIGGLDEDASIHSGKQFYLQHYVASESDLANVNVFSDRPLYYGGAETTPDIFRFNFLGYSGEFMLTSDGSAKFFSTSHPSGEFSMEYDFADNYPSETSFSEIRIKTGNGYCYYFGGEHRNLEFCKSSDAGESPYTITAWKLRKITAPNGNEVEFIYSEFQKDFSIFESYTPEIDADIVHPSFIYGGYAPSQTLQYTNTNFHHLITEIKVNGISTVSFTYESKKLNNSAYKENEATCFDRTLRPNGYGIYNIVADDKKLTGVKIKNISGSVVDEFSLTHRYANGGDASRIFLSTVKSKQSGTHSFEYAVNSSTRLPKNDTNGIDYWGFWNGKVNTNNLKHYIKNPSVTTPLHDLYDQLSNHSVKEANFNYAKQGAMTKIIYPTGGETRIEYEAHNVGSIVSGPNQYRANTQSFVPGGVRVSRLTNVSDDITDYTVYTYDGGVLTHMPRYAIHLNYTYSGRVYTPADEGIPIDEADITAIAYTDDCSLSPLRDPHVIYSEVTETYPDGSSTVNTFYNMNDYNDIKMYLEEHTSSSGVEYIPKEHYYSYEDYISYDGDPIFLDQVRMTLLPPTDDFSRIRGKVKSVKEYDCNENLKSCVEYIYGNYLTPTHTQTMAYNALFDYVKAPYRIYAPLLKGETHSIMYDNGQIQKYTYYTYNDADQMTCCIETTGDKTLTKRYKYFREQFPLYNGDVLKSAVYSKVDIVSEYDNQDYLNCNLIYNYGNLSNPQPSSIDIYTSDKPSAVGTNPFAIPSGYLKRTVKYTYDQNKYRLIREDFPGGVFNTYSWDNGWRNIISKTQNAGINTTLFQWKDMVGPISITYPTQQSNSYYYDNANRLKTIMDSDGNPEIEYRYHLRNE